MSKDNEERYVRADTQGGYLYNKIEIDYFRQSQMLDVIDNLMLGDFNKKGSYIMDKGIVEQLVKIRKIYQYSFGSTTFCQSAQNVGGFGNIDFAIKMKSNKQEGIVSANLQVLETIDRANGYYQNTNSATIATYTAKDSPSFVVDMLKHFNVISKKEEGLLATEAKEEDVGLIVARKKYEKILKDGMLGKTEDKYKALFQKRLKLLSKSGVGKKILQEFEKETYKVNGWFLKEGMPGYYRYLNQILDGLVEMHSEEVFGDVALKAAWNKENEHFANAMNTMVNHNIEVAVKGTDASMRNENQLANEARKDNVEHKTAVAQPKEVTQPAPKPQEVKPKEVVKPQEVHAEQKAPEEKKIAPTVKAEKTNELNNQKLDNLSGSLNEDAEVL